MRRAVARGRLFPQSYSTDRRYGRLSLKAIGLFPLMWANADDQGRLCGDPEEIKYAVCPNIDHITKTDIPEVLAEIEKNGLLKVYDAGETPAIQLLDWWDVHRPQWAYPSQYPPPEGWKDRLRYHRTPTEVIMENWVPPGQYDRALPSALPSSPLGVSGSALPSAQSTPPKRNYKKESGKEKGGGDIKVPSALGSKTTTTSQKERTTGDEIPRSESEIEESLCEGDREVISVWRSVKGFDMSLADASALVATLRTEFPDVDILAESKAWAARKLSEPLKPSSRPSAQIWNFMRLARQFAEERRQHGQTKGERVTAHPRSDYSGKW